MKAVNRTGFYTLSHTVSGWDSPVFAERSAPHSQVEDLHEHKAERNVGGDNLQGQYLLASRPDNGISHHELNKMPCWVATHVNREYMIRRQALIVHIVTHMHCSTTRTILLP